ncbi:MAG: BLUF domain-containing protein [Hoeflea sp.]|uniref:BLUF domain-containing protein n=1 Tax=Hoeflea sp. TaxID=1940281 RepID=UPI00272F3DB1|nr:BLUF domain-containing protein [Hoeflea sp.]MDP2119777.1 BLUF domain-containing protein [Hoeflea sp.]MDZ7603522.1 BLUF domain-containing protein [Hoeflea sp.]
MLQILYVSGASRPMSDADIEDILTVSKRNNVKAGITGMLLWADGMFIQVLEGEVDKVRALAARIRSDARHRHFMMLLEHQSEDRLFSEWSMGFKRLDVSRAADKNLFQISRTALSQRVGDHDGGMFLDAIVAFSRDFIPGHEARSGAAVA